MNIKKTIELLNNRAGTFFDVYERRPGKYQLIIPILHEDGDMIDIYLQDSPENKSYIRICDFGLTEMRLSYTYEITPSRKIIFDSILTNNGVQNDNESLYLDTTPEMLYEGIMQFAGCVQKICSLSYWNRETVRSSFFYKDLEKYAITELQEFNPRQDISPLPDYDIITVDWSLSYKDEDFYLFGVKTSDKANKTTIALLEFKKAKLPFTSLIVHENMEGLGNRASTCLTKNADQEYPTVADFKENVIDDIKEIAA